MAYRNSLEERVKPGGSDYTMEEPGKCCLWSIPRTCGLSEQHIFTQTLDNVRVYLGTEHSTRTRA